MTPLPAHRTREQVSIVENHKGVGRIAASPYCRLFRMGGSPYAVVLPVVAFRSHEEESAFDFGGRVLSPYIAARAYFEVFSIHSLRGHYSKTTYYDL